MAPGIAAACALLALLLPLGLRSSASEASRPAYQNPRLDVEQRVDDLLSRMTVVEKLDMLTGSTWMESTPNSRLGIPKIRMADGPAGVRPATGPGGMGVTVAGTAFPAGVALAATWDVELVGKVGRAIGMDARALGRDMILGPTVNIHRAPEAGRNFETFGEDPYLTSRLAVAFIQGLQAEGVMAVVKHFAANNQETDRYSVDVRVDERTLNEIYLPAFRAAVQEAGVWSVMSAYNKVNGVWCTENPSLLTDVLKKQWGFRGFVVSDWVATHTTVETANAGLDLEMPGTESRRMLLKRMPSLAPGFNGHPDAYMNRPELLQALADGRVKQAVVNDKVRRLLRAMFSNGLFDGRPPSAAVADGPEQRRIARMAAAEAIVLLKNQGRLLPLGPQVRSIAVIGPNAATARTGGGGSSEMKPASPVSPLEGIRQRAGAGIKVGYALGCPLPASGRTLPPQAPRNESPDDPATRAARLREAVELAAGSDVAIVFAGYSSGLDSEGFDRDLRLPVGQDELIQAVAAANRNTIVVLNSGGPVLMSAWIDRVPSALATWYLGQEAGNAVAAVLFGDENPSGKLPATFLREAKDSAAYRNFPGSGGTVSYKEGLYVGYRHFDRNRLDPLFPFGYGLSYTTFTYRNLKISPSRVVPGQRVEVTLDVRNTGTRRGVEVVQLYIHDVEASVDRPDKELKSFRRVELDPGQTRTVSFYLDDSAMAFYHPGKKGWVAEPGSFETLVGSSSRNIELTGEFELTAATDK